jgi:hypothetical protein
MAVPPKKSMRAPPPASIAQLDPELNRWFHDLARLLNGVVPPPTVASNIKLGVDGDWYCDTAAKHIYVKVAGAWKLIL